MYVFFTSQPYSKNHMWYRHRGPRLIELASGNTICSRIVGCRSWCTTWMGPIRFATGSHHKGFVPGVRGLPAISDKSQDFFQQLVAAQSGNKRWSRGRHHSTMGGRFTANQIDKMWPAMIYLLIPTVQRWMGWVILVRSNEAEHFLGGKQEGGLTDSEMNTIVC